MLGFPHQTGMGKLYSEATGQRGPQLLTALLADMEVVGEWVRRSNEKIMKTRCSTRFLIEPWLDHKKLRQSIGHSDDEVHILPLPGGFQKYVGGGIVWFYAEGSLRDSHLPQGHYLHLQIGFGLELEKGASSVQFFAYTVFYGNQLKSDTYKESGYFKKLPKEQDALDVFRSCLRASTKEALKLTSGSSKALLKKFVIPN
jgi:hypothetical protein